jgi:PAS domain S-box-containing protein
MQNAINAERYRHLLNSIEQGFCIIELMYDTSGVANDYRFLEVNPAFERHTGLRDAIGKTARELVPNIEPVWFEIYDRVARSGEPAELEQGSTAMGRLFKIEAVRIGDQDSRKVSLLFSNITERRKSLDALATTNDRLKLVLESADLGIWDWDFQSGDNVWNDTMFRLLGYVPGAVTANQASWSSRVFADDVLAVDAQFAANVKNGGEFRAEYRVLGQGDKVRWVEARGQTKRSADGQITRSYGVLMDVTERKTAEDKVSLSEVRYRRLFEAAHDGVLLIDPSTRKIIDANPFMSNLLGYPHAELVGKELFQIGLLEDEAASKDMVRTLKLTSQVRYDDLPLENRNGKHQEVEVVANLYDENGNAVIQCNIRDITERKRAETLVKLLMAEVNHRAKNLLAVVQAVAKQTMKHGDPATIAARLFDRIGALAAGQDLLVKNHWKGVDLTALVSAQLAHFKDLIGTRIILDGPALEVKADAAQCLGMALHELSTNASKYGALSTSGGRVRISWSSSSGPDAQFRMIWSEEGGPRVVPPTRMGFGHVIVGRMAEATLEGLVDASYAVTGFTWKLSAPLKNVST